VRYLVAVFLMIIPHLALSQTEVNGNQSGVWTLAGSPYLVTGEIVVPASQTLSIEPGVEVNFQGHYKFSVYGNLQAIGAENGIIFFTTDNPATGWGGIRIDSDVICTLSYCRIEYGKTAGDYPDMHGGGLALIGSDAVVSHCVFADNDATADDLGMGGAVYGISTGGPGEPLTRFINCRFIRNHAYGEGGAIKFTGDINTEISGCDFIENDCFYGGGAISCYAVSGTNITDSLFAGNYTMYSSGGAINTLGSGNTLYLANCTFFGNTAVTGDGGAMNLAYGTAYFANTIVYQNNGMYSDDVHLDWGGFAEIHYCDMPMPAGGTGDNNMDVDPQFVDAGNGDFRLAESSPCIDAGTDYIFLGGRVLVDLDSDQYCGTAPDMGAREYCAVTGALDEPLTVFKLDRNHPNPFNTRTSISYNLVDHARVRGREKRGGAVAVLTVTAELPVADDDRAVEILVVDDLLTTLADLDARAARVHVTLLGKYEVLMVSATTEKSG